MGGATTVEITLVLSSDSLGARVFAYAGAVDNRSGNPVFTPGREVAHDESATQCERREEQWWGICLGRRFGSRPAVLRQDNDYLLTWARWRLSYSLEHRAAHLEQLTVRGGEQRHVSCPVFISHGDLPHRAEPLRLSRPQRQPSGRHPSRALIRGSDCPLCGPEASPGTCRTLGELDRHLRTRHRRQGASLNATHLPAEHEVRHLILIRMHAELAAHCKPGLSRTESMSAIMALACLGAGMYAEGAQVAAMLNAAAARAGRPLGLDRTRQTGRLRRVRGCRPPAPRLPLWGQPRAPRREGRAGSGLRRPARGPVRSPPWARCGRP